MEDLTMSCGTGETKMTQFVCRVGTVNRNVHGLIYIQTKLLGPFLIKYTVAHCVRWQLAEMNATEKEQNMGSPRERVGPNLLDKTAPHSACLAASSGGERGGRKVRD